MAAPGALGEFSEKIARRDIATTCLLAQAHTSYLTLRMKEKKILTFFGNRLRRADAKVFVNVMIPCDHHGI
jgi:hypothetical protein